MRNGPGGFGMLREQWIDDIPLNLGGYDVIIEHLGLDNNCDLNLLTLPQDLKNEIIQQIGDLEEESKKKSHISLGQVLKSLGIQSYEIASSKSSSSEEMKALGASYYGMKNGFGDLNISSCSDIIGGCYGKKIYFYNIENPGTLFQNLIRKTQKRIVYKLENSQKRLG